MVIHVDDSLIAKAFVPRIDEARNHYDVRSEYTRQCAEALGEMADKTLFQVGVNAARAGGPLTEIPGGSIVKNTAMATDAKALIASLTKAAQEFDEKNVPSNNRFLYLKPAQYYLLMQDEKLFQASPHRGTGIMPTRLSISPPGFLWSDQPLAVHQHHHGQTGSLQRETLPTP